MAMMMVMKVIMTMTMMMSMVITMMMIMVITLMVTLCVRCSYTWAKKVLKAMEAGKVKELARKRKRRTAITETEWPARVMEALLSPHNVRMTPGRTSVSVAHGVRKPLGLLLKTRRQIVEEVREKVRKERMEEREEGEEEEKLPSIATLLTLIPKNFRQPKERDRVNNVCTKHSNMTHLVSKLRPVLPSLPLSSRELSGLVMCPPSTEKPFTLDQPLTWRKECALRWEIQKYTRRLN